MGSLSDSHLGPLKWCILTQVPRDMAAMQWSLVPGWLTGSGLHMRPHLALHGGSLKQSLWCYVLWPQSLLVKVKWFTDNMNVVHIVETGSRKQHL